MLVAEAYSDSSGAPSQTNYIQISGVAECVIFLNGFALPQEVASTLWLAEIQLLQSCR